MPKNENGQVKCINENLVINGNAQHPMHMSDKTNALTTVLKEQSGQILFKPDSGIPVKAHVCMTCGYVELYLDPSI